MGTKRGRKSTPEAGVGIIGAIRLNIVNPDGTIAADSGWKKNRIVNQGLHGLILQTILRTTGSCSVAYMAVGSVSSTCATDANSLPQQCVTNHMVTVSSSSSTRATSTDGALARYLATFASNNFSGATTIGNAGIMSAQVSTALMAGAAFATSAVATNQAINCTYDISFVSTTT